MYKISQLYINSSLQFRKYIIYLIECLGPWTIPGHIPDSCSNTYNHNSNKINIDILKSDFFNNIIKKSEEDINIYIDSDYFLKGLINSYFVYEKGINNISILLDEIFKNNELVINNETMIVFNSLFKGLSSTLNKKNKFFRHFLENYNYHDLKINEIYPPLGSYFHENGAWPCEFGNATLKRGQIGNSVMVDCNKNTWEGEFWGLVALKTFDKYNGKLVMGNDIRKTSRDHLYANAKIPVNEWIFMLENLKNNEKTNKALEHLVSHCGIIETETVQAIQGVKELLIGKIFQLSRIE